MMNFVKVSSTGFVEYIWWRADFRDLVSDELTRNLREKADDKQEMNKLDKECHRLQAQLTLAQSASAVALAVCVRACVRVCV